MVEDIRLARALTIRYVVGLSLIACLTTGAWISLDLVIASQENTAAVVNISGRQRMLSQRLAMFSSLLVTSDPQSRSGIREQLRNTVALMRESHENLIRGNPELRLPNTLSSTIHAMYFQEPDRVDNQIKEYLAHVEQLIQTPDSQLTLANRTFLQIIDSAAYRLVESLDRLVSQYQLEGEQAVSNLQTFETYVWLSTLFLLLLEALLIFRPFSQRLRLTVGKLQETKSELKKLNDHLESLVQEKTRNLEEKALQLARLSQAVEQNPHSIIITNPDGKIEYVNAAFSKFTGYSREEAIGRSPKFLTSGDTPEETYKSLKETLLRGDVWRGEFSNRNRNGMVITISATICPVLDEAGAVRSYLSIQEDVTPLKSLLTEVSGYRDHLEELVETKTRELELARESAEVANKAKSTFLANMTHEIRTPLSAITGMACLIRKESLTPKQADYLKKVELATDHLLAIINSILDLSKIEAGKLELEKRRMDPAALVGNIESIIDANVVLRGINIITDVCVLPYPVVGDGSRIQQCLLNLVGNAVKFSKAGDSISVRTRIVESNEHQLLLRFEVQDQGIGISQTAMAKLFAPFEQADSSTSRKYGGSGLGLVLTRRLAELMGGEVGASSEEGVGSLFWFTVVLYRAETEQNLLAEDDSQLAGVDLKTLHGKRVLLVEDDPINQEIAVMLLQDLGLSVEVAMDGMEAVEKASSRSYDLILMDMQMPRMDGLDATRAIRKAEATQLTPIVAMTANAFVEDQQNCLESGMNDFLSKPVIPADLANVMKKWLL